MRVLTKPTMVDTSGERDETPGKGSLVRGNCSFNCNLWLFFSRGMHLWAICLDKQSFKEPGLGNTEKYNRFLGEPQAQCQES